MILQNLGQDSFWTILVDGYVPRHLLRLEEIGESRDEKCEYVASQSTTAFALSSPIYMVESQGACNGNLRVLRQKLMHNNLFAINT